ncbi:MAG: hypothetical protein WC740_20005 [Verrucomicrobiia bacterium]
MQTESKSSGKMAAVQSASRPMVHLHLTRRVYVVLLMVLIAPWVLLAAAWLARDLLLSFQVSKASANVKAETRTGGRVTYAAPGPWGTLRCTRIAIEPPSEAIFVKREDEAPSRWHFVGYTIDKLRELFATVGFRQEQISFLIERTHVNPATGTLVVSPTPEFVIEMAPVTRQRLYSVLAAFLENPAQRFVSTFRPMYLNERFEDSELPPEVIADIKRMTYPHGDILLFADVNIMLARMPDPGGKVRLLKALARKNTLLVELEINSTSIIEKLVNYWAAGGRAKDIEPLLTSLWRTPGGASVDISHLLPRFARQHLYTFAYASGPEIELRRDCHWTSLNFFNLVPDDRYVNPVFAYEVVRSGYYVISGGARLGDLVLLANAKGKLVHSAVCIADDIVFTKNGAGSTHPWMFMKMADLLELYEGTFQSEGPLQVMYYRKRAD